jgi:tetratricopeptide (TPR) repeat protein
MAHDVFISYSTKDTAWADAVCATLEANGISCWIAPRDIPIGTDYPAALARAVRDCRVVVLIYSADSNNSTFVHKEIEAVASRKNSIVPFRIENVPPSDELALLINTSQWLDADIKDPEKSVALLVPAVQHLLTSAPATSIEKIVVPKLPKLVYTYKRLRRMQIGAIAALLFAVIGTGLYFYLTRVDSVLVMPFRVPGGQKEVDNYLQIEFPSNIVGALSTLPKLRARPGDDLTLRRWAESGSTPEEVSKELGVKKVLLGEFTMVGGKLTFKATLKDSSTNSRLWGFPNPNDHGSSQSCLKDPQDQNRLLPLRKSVLEGVLDHLDPTPSAADRQRVLDPPTDSCEAYDLYLRARYEWNDRNSAGFKNALRHYQDAIKLDPKFALALSGMADVYNLMADYSDVRPEDPAQGFPAALDFANKAIAINPDLAESHISKAFVLFQFEWNWTAAQKEFDIAFAKNPHYATGLQWYAVYLSALGRNSEAIDRIKDAMEEDKTAPIIRTNLGWLFHLARRDDEAEKELLAVIQMKPDFEEAHRQLGDVYLARNDFNGALAQYSAAEKNAIQHSEKGEGGIEYESLIARAQALLGQRDEALQAIEKLKKIADYYPASYVALIYIALGDKDSAFQWLDQSIKDRSDEMILLKVDPAYDPLRSDPRFTELLKRVGLPQ